MVNFFHAVLWRLAWMWERVWFAVAVWIDLRPRRRLIAGTPALLLGIAIAVLALRCQFSRDDRVLAHYSRLFSESLDEDQPTATELWARKLVQLDASASEAVFGQAWLAQRRGDTEAAAELLRQLAPDDKAGYPRAHLWRAKSLLRQSHDVVVDMTVVVHHLRQALAEPSQRQTARELLAAVFIANKDYPAAIEQLQVLVIQRPELRLQLSQLYALTGQQQRSRDELRRALGFYRNAAKQQPTNPKVQISWANAEAAGGNLKRAEAILLAGVETEQGAVFRKALSSLYVVMSDRLDRDDATKTGERLQLLERALHYTPGHQGALVRIAKTVQAGERADDARSLLQDALARGNAPALVHLLLGTVAAGEKDWKSARLHLQQARQLNPKSPILLNNLAWVLASAEPAQPELALQLVNTALKLAPHDPEIRATRGRVLMLLERWQEALTDFELALIDFPNRKSLHQSLATVYKQLGEMTMAQHHQALAEGTADKR